MTHKVDGIKVGITLWDIIIKEEYSQVHSSECVSILIYSYIANLSLQ